MKRTPVLWLDLAVKLSLVLLLAFGAFSGLERFAGKAFGWRLVGYSIAALIVPLIWVARGKRPPYPFATDTLFVLPFLIGGVFLIAFGVFLEKKRRAFLKQIERAAT